MLVYTITKGNNKSYVYDVYHGAQGAKGDTGPQGEQGVQGIPGLAATIQVGTVTSGSSVSVVNTGSSNAAVFDFVLEKGDKGDQGPVGQSAGFGTPTAAATTLEAGASAAASVVASGDATQKVFAFTFGIPKGDKGDQGIQGETGATGPAAGFGTPTASATLLPSGSNPTASVTASGADTAKIFDFSFGIPAGDTNVQADWNQTNTSADDYIKNKPTIPNSWNIEVSNFTSSTMVLKAYKNGAAYTGSIFAYLTYGDGTTSQRTANPLMLTASSGTITITSSEFPDIATVLADATKTNFFFEFQESFSGSIFYSVSYVRGKLTDVWELANPCWDTNNYSRITFNVYKNGAKYTGALTSKCIINVYSHMGYMQQGTANSIINQSGSYSISLSSISALNHLDPSYREVTLIFTDTDYNSALFIGTFTREEPAASIADGDNGFTTGDQVYDYVAAHEFDIDNLDTETAVPVLTGIAAIETALSSI